MIDFGEHERRASRMAAAGCVVQVAAFGLLGLAAYYLLASGVVLEAIEAIGAAWRGDR